MNLGLLGPQVTLKPIMPMSQYAYFIKKFGIEFFFLLLFFCWRAWCHICGWSQFKNSFNEISTTLGYFGFGDVFFWSMNFFIALLKTSSRTGEVMFEYVVRWCWLEYVEITDLDHVIVNRRGSRTKRMCPMHSSIPAPNSNDILFSVWCLFFKYIFEYLMSFFIYLCYKGFLCYRLKFFEYFMGVLWFCIKCYLMCVRTALLLDKRQFSLRERVVTVCLMYELSDVLLLVLELQSFCWYENWYTALTSSSKNHIGNYL